MSAGRRVLLFVGVVAVVGITAAAALGALSWGSAVAVPGLGALNVNNYATVNSISCAGTNTCAAGGYYQDGAGSLQAFVADETSGTWGNAIEVPGTAALNGAGARVNAISCGSVGDCAAGGSYTDGSGAQQAFVVREVGGAWGNAVEVPGTAALNFSGAQVTAISCPTAGNCAAGGYYTDPSAGVQVFVVNEKNGVWGKAIQVPGTAALNTGASAAVASISCGSPGYCTVGGSYFSGPSHTFVATSKGGVWGKAIQVPGTTALKDAKVTSVSCAGAKFCVAGGTYYDGSSTQSFVTTGTLGKTGKWAWGKAAVVKGAAVGGYTQLNSLACSSTASCTAGGQFFGPNGNQAFVLNRTGGVWGKANELPGVAAFSNYSYVTSISCSSAGNCAAMGFENNFPSVFVAGEANGVWGNALELPGMAALADSSPSGSAISCAPGGTTCGIGGQYYSNAKGWQGFVTAPQNAAAPRK